jgi:hypothetical protein
MGDAIESARLRNGDVIVCINAPAPGKVVGSLEPFFRSLYVTEEKE